MESFIYGLHVTSFLVRSIALSHVENVLLWQGLSFNKNVLGWVTQIQGSEKFP